MYCDRIIPRHGSYPCGAYNLLGETYIQQAIIRILIKFTDMSYDSITMLKTTAHKYTHASTHIHIYKRH